MTQTFTRPHLHSYLVKNQQIIPESICNSELHMVHIHIDYHTKLSMPECQTAWHETHRETKTALGRQHHCRCQ